MNLPLLLDYKQSPFSTGIVIGIVEQKEHACKREIARREETWRTLEESLVVRRGFSFYRSLATQFALARVYFSLRNLWAESETARGLLNSLTKHVLIATLAER